MPTSVSASKDAGHGRQTPFAPAAAARARRRRRRTSRSSASSPEPGPARSRRCSASGDGMKNSEPEHVAEREHQIREQAGQPAGDHDAGDDPVERRDALQPIAQNARGSQRACASAMTHMMKPLMTKKTSTPAAPMAKWSPVRSAAWKTTTASAAKRAQILDAVELVHRQSWLSGSPRSRFEAASAGTGIGRGCFVASKQPAA